MFNGSDRQQDLSLSLRTVTKKKVKLVSLSKHFIDCRKRYVLLIESHSAYEINCCETGLANDVNDPMNFKHSYAGLIEIVSNQLNVVNCTR